MLAPQCICLSTVLSFSIVISNSNSGTSYHDSNKDGSYYYANDNGSKCTLTRGYSLFPLHDLP